MLRYLPADCAAFLLDCNVSPRRDWSEDIEPPCNRMEHVGWDEAVQWVATNAAGLASPLVCGAPAGEVDCAADAGNPPRLYEHQRRALDATLRHDGARSRMAIRCGTWIMPCGAGKTRTGVALLVRLWRSGVTGTLGLVVVPNVEVAEQWRREFEQLGLTGVHVVGTRRVCAKALLGYARDGRPRVVIASLTSIIGHLRSKRYDPVMTCIVHVLTYAVMLVDEVHTLPATSHTDALCRISARAVVGMTAEVSRSDGRHEQILQRLPVLFSMDARQSEARGITMHVQAILIHVPMDPSLVEAYRSETNAERRRLLALLNPQKFAVLRSLLTVRECQHKVIIYCDKLKALPTVERCLTAMHVNFVGTISGNKRSHERLRVCDRLRACEAAVALVTRAGSASLDIRDLDCIIELDVSDAGIQKNTQRAGRPARVHENKQEARRYMLASVETRETYFANRRLGSVAHEVRQPDMSGSVPSDCPQTAQDAVGLVARLA